VTLQIKDAVSQKCRDNNVIGRDFAGKDLAEWQNTTIGLPVNLLQNSGALLQLGGQLFF
jgi:hypothetical protein